MIDKSKEAELFGISENIFYEEILSLALENLKLKNKKYHNLIKLYILNYDKTDIKIRLKLKNIIIFIQKQIEKYGEKRTLDNINKTLDNLGVKKNKKMYLRLYCACIVYDEAEIIN